MFAFTFPVQVLGGFPAQLVLRGFCRRRPSGQAVVTGVFPLSLPPPGTVDNERRSQHRPKHFLARDSLGVRVAMQGAARHGPSSMLTSYCREPEVDS